ncbi:MAG: ribosomal RNA small subunit methyltransferase A [Candidatus Omnitrophica bacterium]|nr:ribosomal RNA small subunit methyltransferase A [Candidatus Omnitrophota bacterium]
MPTQIEILKRHNLSLRKSLGQNFLIDPNIQRKIVDLLELEESDRLLEIGPGLGALSFEILNRGFQLTAIERDQRMIRFLEEELGEEAKKTIHLIHGDILDFDFRQWARGVKKGGQVKVLSNLPYYLTSPILFYLTESRSLIERGVLTMQKEVAKRLLATPGSKDYGRLTLGLRYSAEIVHAFDISRRCFAPEPDVDSTVLVLKFRARPSGFSKKEEEFLFDLIKVAFSQRRKTLLHLLSRWPKIKQDRSNLEKRIVSLGFDSKVRAEELLLKDFMALAEALN